ncbi:MAG: folylpolyglutamate synthase/dihydrofolate synthase family protein [Gaiellaceae bacterium]
MASAADWLESLSPWPVDGFGLAGICALMEELDEPQRAYPAVHVVGTNGKSTTARMIEALLSAAGLRVGTYLSPHVRGWAERIRVGGEEADFEAAIARVRAAGERVGATQFEVLTAAALAVFAEAGVDVAVVEAGLGGRHDATNVLRTEVVVLTSVGLEHTDVLGHSREQIAAEKLAVVPEGAAVVLGEAEWADLAEAQGAREVVIVSGSNLALAVAAAEAFVGHAVDPGPAADVRLPGRLERRGESPLELWDGAHNLAGIGWLLPRIPRRLYVVVASILEDKRPTLMLEALSVLGRTLVATTSSNVRALGADELATAAGEHFETVEAVPEPAAAVARARELAGPDGAVLVTGSLYLLSDLTKEERLPWRTSARS